VKASQTSFSARRSSSSAEQLVDHLLDRPPWVGGSVECGDASFDPFHDKSHREGEQLGLRSDVVAQCPGRPAGLVGDGADRSALDAVAPDHPPHGVPE
jgi:hypothetical protein